MNISVIIPTYNEENVILECLKSLSKQSIKDFEIIVVDDGSTDNTYEILSKLKNTKSELVLIKGQHEGAGAARNLGAKSAKGDALVFIDADMTFDKNFLKMLVKPIILGKTKGTFSKDEMVSNWSNIWAKCWNINEGWENKKRHPKKYPSKQKVFRSILKSEFDRVGGFTPGGYNDDWSLSEKLGYESDLAPKAFFFHKNPGSLKEVFYHAMWVGKRPYKFGIFGSVFALVRSSFPISILIGFLRFLITAQFAFILFKIIYDFGTFIGIIKFMFTKKGAK